MKVSDFYKLLGGNNKSKNHSIYLKDIARYILKNNRDKFKGMTDTTFTDIINRIFELKVADLYVNGYVNIGYGLGKIGIFLRQRNNSSIKNYAVNWNETLKLWSVNQKAKEEKKLVRVLSYDKYVQYMWNNKRAKPSYRYYNFLPFRSVRKQLYFDVINNKNIMFYE